MCDIDLFGPPQNDYGLDAVTSQKICMGNANFDRIQECTEYARSKMPTPEEANEAITHVEEPFNLWDYTRGYSNDKVLVFECLGWISDEDGRINVDAIKEFMSTTAVASYFEGDLFSMGLFRTYVQRNWTDNSNLFEGDMGDENLSSCAVQSETMTVNDFFNGIEPNNQVPCDCEGDVCLDDQGDDEEAKAESRFSLQSLVKGKPEKIAKQLIKRIHDGETQTFERLSHFSINQIKKNMNENAIFRGENVAS